MVYDLKLLKERANEYLLSFKLLMEVLDKIRMLQGAYNRLDSGLFKLLFSQYGTTRTYVSEGLYFSEEGNIENFIIEDDLVKFDWVYLEKYNEYPDKETMSISFPATWLDIDPAVLEKSYKNYLQAEEKKRAEKDNKLNKEKAKENKKKKEEKEKLELERLIKKYGIPQEV